MRTQELHPLTEKINKKQKANSKQLRTDALQWLAKTFPAAFDDSESIHPLKAGIMLDILAHADKLPELSLSKSKLREAVILFTRRIDYLVCLKAREMRIDLDGNPTVLVSEEEALQAADKIKKQIEKAAKIARQNATPHDTAYPASKNSPPPKTMLTSYPYTNDIHYDTQPNPASRSSASVIIKHKTLKPFDPVAVARLKEKLGLGINQSTSN